jgi:8-oxo-dGTP pyrophosphatase MutT (NUDIX family)
MMAASAGGRAWVATQGASVIVLRRGAVLMVERRLPPFAGLWSFPGGRAEPGEDAAAAACRELFEETGLEVERMVRIGSFNPGPDPIQFRLTVFAARAGTGRPVAADDASQAEFVPLHLVLTRPATPGAAGWIARALVALSEPPLL